jgi:hypothetical protein
MPPAGLIDSAYRLVSRKSTLTFKNGRKIDLFPQSTSKINPSCVHKVLETSLFDAFPTCKSRIDLVNQYPRPISTVFSFHNFLAHQPDAFFLAVR